MRIRDVRIYIRPGEPQARSVGNRGGMEKAPPGLSGLFTHAAGFGAPPELPASWLEACTDDTLHPTWTATLRLVTDGPLDAYTSFGNGFHPDDLTHQARRFKVEIGPLLLGVDAFDREYIWQRLWYTQRFYYTGRGVVDMVDRMLWGTWPAATRGSRCTASSAPAERRCRRTATTAGTPSTRWWPMR